ncbi:DUF3077 domain-containing protein [Pseudomonas jinjuensis]|uniref:DUF3077 domain-containing protein n=1 Tax=Pseudomonas jinjuensis TaxID=198616 RepID=UPI000A01C10E|nr:DUF3077 domain-containing protein [Pseudomonas jinjuensis]
MNRLTAVTRQESFAGRADAPLLSVNAGVPVTDALEHASCLLASVKYLAGAMGHEMLSADEGAFTIQYLTDMAKALVDAAAMGCQAHGRGERHGQDS